MVNVSRVHSLYIRMHYLVEEPTLLSGAGLDQLTLTVIDSIDLLQGALEAKASKRINYAEIDVLIDEIWRTKIIDWPISASTVKGLTRTAFGKIFNPPTTVAFWNPQATTRPVVEGMTQTGLDQLKDGILGWIEMQRLWRELTAKAIDKDPSLKNADGTINPIPYAMIREIWPTLRTHHRRPFQEMKSLFRRETPLAFTKEGTILFDRFDAPLSMDQQAFNSLNWKAAFARMVSLGFSIDPVLNRFRGVTKPEFKEFFEAVKPLGVELKLVDPTDNTLWDTSFDEANMFMLSGDGNTWLSFSEGVDFVSYALSQAYMADRVLDDLTKNCRNYEPDVFGIPKVDARCFRHRLKTNFVVHYNLIPGWANYVAQMDGVEYDDFQMHLEKAARKKGYSNELVESGDLSRVSMLLHYGESIFTRFDSDRSGTITLAEATKVFPVFKDLLARVSEINDNETLYALFTYILHKGQPPESVTEKLYFQFIWKANKSLWEINADRKQLLKIIGNLKSAA
jgi:hypothetical protein